MILRPFPLDRELDRAVAQWLGWLPRWEPLVAAASQHACEVCPRWLPQLDLDQTPHGPVHALITSVDALVTEQFHRCAREQFPDIGADWEVFVEHGDVRIAPARGLTVQQIEPHLTVHEAFVARVDLLKLYESIVDEAVQRLRIHRNDILHLLSITVDRRVRVLVDELVHELEVL